MPAFGLVAVALAVVAVAAGDRQAAALRDRAATGVRHQVARDRALAEVQGPGRVRGQSAGRQRAQGKGVGIGDLRCAACEAKTPSAITRSPAASSKRSPVRISCARMVET